jgi:hypothetical protein
MSKRTSPLDDVRVAAPCNAGWDNMVGTERVRFCGQCNLNVYNLSAMTRGDAERLIAETEGRLCVRYYRRADGTILTKNCPVGLRALKRRLSRIATVTASAVLTFFAGILAVAGLKENSLLPATINRAVIKVKEPDVIPIPTEPRPMMGAVAPRDYMQGQAVVGQMEVAPQSRRRPHLYE